MNNPIAEENRIAASSVVEDRRTGLRRTRIEVTGDVKHVRNDGSIVRCERKPNSDPRAIISKPEMDCLLNTISEILCDEDFSRAIEIDDMTQAIMQAFRNILLYSAKDRTERFEAAVREILNGKD